MADKRELLEIILSKSGMMDRKNFISIDEVESEPAPSYCQNFVSIMERLVVTFGTEDGKAITTSFILKSKAPGGDLELAALIRPFSVELEIYQNVLAHMNVILGGEESDEIPWPRYFGSNDDSLLLEDLRTKGFKVAEEPGMMDIDHAKLAVEGLAKFHALSMIVVKRGLFDKNSLSPSIYAQNIQFMMDMQDSAFKALALSMERSWGEQWQTEAKRVRLAAKYVGDKLKKLWNDTKGQYDVINHGDCWTNNMLFKYSNITSKPTSVKLVDFQLCHYNSPCWDLVHFLYTALLPDTRERHLTSLLTTYADCLDKTCQRFGYNGSIPRITYLQETIQKLSYYAFVLSCSSLPVLIMSSPKLNPEGVTLDHEENTCIHYPMYKLDIVRETMKAELTWFLQTCKQMF